VLTVNFDINQKSI